MVKGENTLEAGTPASFDVLTNEVRGLGQDGLCGVPGGVLVSRKNRWVKRDFS